MDKMQRRPSALLRSAVVARVPKVPSSKSKAFRSAWTCSIFSRSASTPSSVEPR